MTPLDYARLLPWLTAWEEIRWARQRGYHEHAQRLQDLLDKEWEE